MDCASAGAPTSIAVFTSPDLAAGGPKSGGCGRDWEHDAHGLPVTLRPGDAGEGENGDVGDTGIVNALGATRHLMICRSDESYTSGQSLLKTYGFSTDVPLSPTCFLLFDRRRHSVSEQNAFYAACYTVP